MAPAEDDISIEEKRVYAGSAGRTDAYVATESGVVRVALSADKIGSYDMATREPARDVAVLPQADRPDLLGVATDQGLRVAPVGDDLAFEGATDDPAVAVGVCDGGFFVAAEDGGIDRVAITGRLSEPPGPQVTRIGELPAVRAVDGPLVGTVDGVFRVTGKRDPTTSAGGAESAPASYDLTAVGLTDARDVAGSGMPLAATAAGVYWLGNGWMTALEGDATTVAADGDDHAMAVVDGDLFVHESDDDEWDTETWAVAELPVDEEPAALGYGPGLSVAVTDAGTLCVDAGDGWRHQVVGVRGVAGVALGVVE